MTAEGIATAAIQPGLTWCPAPPPARPADAASRITDTAIAATHQNSTAPKRSRRTSRDSTSTSATPEASTGCTRLTGSNVSTTIWQASPRSMSANPASQAGSASRLAITRGTRRRSRAGIRARARFSWISPTL
jgi:hypothetical protein